MLGGVGIDPFSCYKPLNSGVVEDRQNQQNQRIGGNMIENTDCSNLKVGDIVGHNSSVAIALNKRTIQRSRLDFLQFA